MVDNKILAILCNFDLMGYWSEEKNFNVQNIV